MGQWGGGRGEGRKASWSCTSSSAVLTALIILGTQVLIRLDCRGQPWPAHGQGRVAAPTLPTASGVISVGFTNLANTVPRV